MTETLRTVLDLCGIVSFAGMVIYHFVKLESRIEIAERLLMLILDRLGVEVPPALSQQIPPAPQEPRQYKPRRIW